MLLLFPPVWYQAHITKSFKGKSAIRSMLAHDKKQWDFLWRRWQTTTSSLLCFLLCQLYKPAFRQPRYQRCSSRTPSGRRLRETGLYWKQWEDTFSHTLHPRRSPTSSEWLPSLCGNRRRVFTRGCHKQTFCQSVKITSGATETKVNFFSAVMQVFTCDVTLREWAKRCRHTLSFVVCVFSATDV